MFRRESFSSVAGNFSNVDYNTMEVKCDNLTGTDACVVKTVKPKRKEVCTKKLDFINPTKRIQDMNARASVKNMEQLNRRDKEFQDDMGMSLDQLANNFDDDVDYVVNINREKNNSKILNIIDNKKYKDNNTLSDIDEQLLSLS